MSAKYGSQVKDEGIQYMRWTLQHDNQQGGSSGKKDYISLLRGKSNVVQVFDTQTENNLFSKKYSELGQIKGLGTWGKDVFDIKHIIVDEKGKLVVDKISEKKYKPSAEFQLALVPGAKVSCLAQNVWSPSQVVIGCKDTLLQIWDVSLSS